MSNPPKLTASIILKPNNRGIPHIRQTIHIDIHEIESSFSRSNDTLSLQLSDVTGDVSIRDFSISLPLHTWNYIYSGRETKYLKLRYHKLSTSPFIRITISELIDSPRDSGEINICSMGTVIKGSYTISRRTLQKAANKCEAIAETKRKKALKSFSINQSPCKMTDGFTTVTNPRPLQGGGFNPR